MKAVENEIRYLPQTTYAMGSTSEFARLKNLAASVPVTTRKAARAAQGQAQGSAPLPQIPVSRNMRTHRGNGFSLVYPENWQSGAGDGGGITIAPKEGVVASSGGGTAIGAGVVIGFAQGSGDLRRDTEALVQQMAQSNQGLSAQGSSRSMRVDGQSALVVSMQSPSPVARETEIDTLVTVQRPQGLFYAVFITPGSLSRNMQSTFETMLRSIRFSQ
jgi:hypothetical protein